MGIFILTSLHHTPEQWVAVMAPTKPNARVATRHQMEEKQQPITRWGKMYLTDVISP